jgi:hypothetical protein
MTVEILPLNGLPVEEADQAAQKLVDIRTGPPRIERLLVLDDTALLTAHGPVYHRLVSSGRVYSMLCVAVGPRPADDRNLRLPWNLGGNQGAGVLWVGDELGIDWRAAPAAVANGHVGATMSGLDQLVQLLSADGVYDRVHDKFEGQVPGRVASPGLKLAGADDEAATFAAALAVAIHRLCDRGSGADGSFQALLPAVTGGAILVPGGSIVRYRDEVAESVDAASDALGRLSGLGGVFKRGDGGVQNHVIEAGAALADLRDLIGGTLQGASTAGELTANQRQVVLAAGVRFPADYPAPGQAQATPAVPEHSPVYQAIASALQGGDTLPLVARRLTQTEREVQRRGSASYLPEVEQRCPAALIARLGSPPPKPPRKADMAQARGELGLDGAVAAARALTDLILTVANREWSPTTPSPGNVARMRIALDGLRKALTEYADARGDLPSGARGARLARLSDYLIPVLRELVLRVIAGESAQPSAGGQEAFQAAHDRAAALLKEWERHVRDGGVSARPPWAGSSVSDGIYASVDDVAEVKAALLYPPDQEMWQLCGTDDFRALNVSAPPLTIRFASRLSKDALGSLPGEQPVWTSSGSFAGLLRLVPLKPGVVAGNSGWAPSAVPDSSSATEFL